MNSPNFVPSIHSSVPEWQRLVANAVNPILMGRRGIVEKDGTHTLQLGENVCLVDATAGAVTITLPAAGKYTGIAFTVKKIDASANAVTVDGAETIDGAASHSLASQWDTVTIISNGTAWFTL